MSLYHLLRSLVLASSFLLSVHVAFAQTSQPPERILDEARTVYLGNLERRAAGAPPLRWNRELTAGARWFAWDSVEQRPEPYCGHQDTQGTWPDARAIRFGYKGSAGAENAFCGYVLPNDAIQGWLASPGHRDNLLDPNSVEIGLGYYLRQDDYRGYVVQAFGVDSTYPPVIIDNEAVTTTTPTVNLYVHSGAPRGGFGGMGPVTEMQIGGGGCLAAGTWQPYTAETSWTLEPGEGWRSVYVTTRDALGRTATVSDTIYLGANVPLDELGDAQMSAARDQVTLFDLSHDELPLVQFSLDWVADDTFETFGLLWGVGERITDTDALGGTAYRLGYTDAGESSAWVWTTEFFRGLPLVAYVRLKVGDNMSPDEVARFGIEGGGTSYGPLSLRGTDFQATDEYQEFPLTFMVHETDDPFLVFSFTRSGSADVTVDAVTIFTAPEPVAPTMTWTVPGGSYRGQGVWVRYTDGGDRFSPYTEAHRVPQLSSLTPTQLYFVAAPGAESPPAQTLVFSGECVLADWRVRTSAAWLSVTVDGEQIYVAVDQAGLGPGLHTAEVIVDLDSGASWSTLVTLAVVDEGEEEGHTVYLPMVTRE